MVTSEAVFTIDERYCTKGWSQDQQDEFNDGDSERAGFDDLSDDDKVKFNAHFRRRDRYERVYSVWEIAEDWEGKVQHGDDMSGESVDQEKWVFPALSGQDPSSPFWVPGMLIETYVPMYDIDEAIYEAQITPELNQPEDHGEEYLRGIVWFGFELAEHLDAYGRVWNVQTNSLKDWPGLGFDVVNGHQQFIADDLFVPEDTYDETDPDQEPFETTEWHATIYMKHQERLLAKWPADNNAVSSDVARVLTVTRDDLHLDWLVEGTYVGVRTVDIGPDDAELQWVRASGGWLRDDYNKGMMIAQTLWFWHGQPRQALDLSFEAIYPGPPVGTLITHIGRGNNVQVVNTVVTSLVLNLKKGTTRLKTQAGELDADTL